MHSMITLISIATGNGTDEVHLDSESDYNAFGYDPFGLICSSSIPAFFWS